jgi:hypothetical protein
MRDVLPVPAMPNTMITVGFFFPAALVLAVAGVGASASRTAGGSAAVPLSMKAGATHCCRIPLPVTTVRTPQAKALLCAPLP